MTELKRYDIYYIEEVGDDGFLEKSYCDDGDNVDAYEALDIITVQKERIEKLEEALTEIFRLADAVFVQRQFSGYTMGSIHALSAKALEAKK